MKKTSVFTRGVEPRWIAVFIFFLIGAFSGGLLTYLYVEATLPPWIKNRLSSDAYQYVNPTLNTQSSEGYTNFNAVSNDLEKKIHAITTSAQQQGKITATSVYFWDFPSGTWIDDNADIQFSPGTQLKIPLMIAYYKLAEQDPKVLDDTIHFAGQYTAQADVFSGKSTLIAGQDYSVSDLIQKMVRDSDETAAALLYDHIDKSTLSEIYTDLGIDFKKASQDQYVIPLKRYGYFFRLLYGANYLSPQYSEQALALLAQDKSGAFLEENVPRSVAVAYRIAGSAIRGKSSVEVYECDVVYYQNRDYLLCALADGERYEDIRSLFAAIGEAVYQNISSQ